MKKTFIRQGDTAVLVGPAEEMRLEYAAYERFRHWLGPNHTLLAQVLDFRDLGELARLTLEFVPGQSLEALLQNRQHEKATVIVRAVLKLLASWEDRSMPGDRAILAAELKQSIESRLERLRALGVARELSELWDYLKHSVFMSDFRLHICHRDLQAGNIILEPSGRVRLIDPRFALHGSRLDTPGHVLIDLVQLKCSLERSWATPEPGHEHRVRLAQTVSEVIDRVNEYTHKPKLYHLVATQRYLNLYYHLSRAGRSEAADMAHQEAKKNIRRLISGCWIK